MNEWVVFTISAWAQAKFINFNSRRLIAISSSFKTNLHKRHLFITNLLKIFIFSLHFHKIYWMTFSLVSQCTHFHLRMRFLSLFAFLALWKVFTVVTEFPVLQPLPLLVPFLWMHSTRTFFLSLRWEFFQVIEYKEMKVSPHKLCQTAKIREKVANKTEMDFHTEIEEKLKPNAYRETGSWGKSTQS